jgi:hypothetical protein
MGRLRQPEFDASAGRPDSGGRDWRSLSCRCGAKAGRRSGGSRRRRNDGDSRDGGGAPGDAAPVGDPVSDRGPARAVGPLAPPGGVPTPGRRRGGGEGRRDAPGAPAVGRQADPDGAAAQARARAARASRADHRADPRPARSRAVPTASASARRRSWPEGGRPSIRHAAAPFPVIGKGAAGPSARGARVGGPAVDYLLVTSWTRRSTSSSTVPLFGRFRLAASSDSSFLFMLR